MMSNWWMRVNVYIYIYKHLVARSVESGNVESDFKMMTLG